MVTQTEITFYRASVKALLDELRMLVYIEHGKGFFPTDVYIANLLGLSANAYSSISRQTASMSGVVLHKLFYEIAIRSAPGDFATTMANFVRGSNHVFCD